MPPQILALLPILLGALGIAYLVVRPLARMWSEKLSDADLDRMIGALKGAVAIADPIVSSTPIKIDNEVVDGLVKVALDEFVRERGRRPKVSAETLTNVARAVAGKSIAAKSGAPVAVPK
jgi:hypothetical protein